MTKSPYSNEQIAVWLRGLLAIAWADGNFDSQEQQLIANITENELAPNLNFCSIEAITPEELVAGLGQDRATAENFLRTAVMVAVVDGVYSESEDAILHKYFQALGQQPTALEALRQTLVNDQDYKIEMQSDMAIAKPNNGHHHIDLLHPVREWLDHLEIHDPHLARFLCKMIPPQCPFERDLKIFGHKIVHIPPMCKLNPLYDQLVGLRFRALSYLADDCHEDISTYC